MGCGHHFIFSHRLHHFTIACLVFLISSSTHLRFIAEGRTLVKPVTISHSQTEKEEKMILRAQIGSRPPRCERRCSTCGHCEAIQVPTNPQIKSGISKNSSSTLSTIAYSRDDYSSNYKPMSWKCKCGNSIFNP